MYSDIAAYLITFSSVDSYVDGSSASLLGIKRCSSLTESVGQVSGLLITFSTADRQVGGKPITFF